LPKNVRKPQAAVGIFLTHTVNVVNEALALGLVSLMSRSLEPHASASAWPQLGLNVITPSSTRSDF